MYTSCKRDCDADFTVSDVNPYAGDAVEFNARSGCNVNSTYLWDFGDGSTSNGMDVMHTFTLAGSFKVTLEVEGKKSEYTVVVK